MKKFKYKVVYLIIILVFIIGLGFFLYPYITEIDSNYKANISISIFKKEIINPDGKSGLEKLYTDAFNYNSEIYLNNQTGLKDQYSYQKSLFSLSDYNLNSNIFGYIEIPTINVKLPLYLGATKHNMELGATQLTYTSLPLDQENTNTVIAAHRGYRGAAFFRNINKIKSKDNIIITNPWGTITYKVIKTEVIKKDDIKSIYIEDGKKLLTLSSCHPYKKNTHRYLVIAELYNSSQHIKK